MLVQITGGTINVDRRFVKKLPKSLWVNVTRGGKRQPTCRYNGRTMTVLRAIGLMAGLSGCQYILPVNGDWFDCRFQNIQASDTVPAKLRAVKHNSTSGVRGVHKSKNAYTVCFVVDGRQKYFGSAKTVEDAQKILTSARQNA